MSPEALHELPARLRALPQRRAPGGGGPGETPSAGELRVFEARSLRARLLGLALLDQPPPDCALLIPRCCSIHTFGMRFAIDVAFLDAAGRPVRVERWVRPGRVLRCRGAAAVLERPSVVRTRAASRR